MLSKNDLKLIKEVVKTEIDSSLETKLESKLEEKLETKLESKLNSKLKPIKNRLNRIEKKLDRAIDVFDRHELEIVKNVRVIQKQLNIPIMEFA